MPSSHDSPPMAPDQSAQQFAIFTIVLRMGQSSRNTKDQIRKTVPIQLFGSRWQGKDLVQKPITTTFRLIRWWKLYPIFTGR